MDKLERAFAVASANHTEALAERAIAWLQLQAALLAIVICLLAAILWRVWQ